MSHIMRQVRCPVSDDNPVEPSKCKMECLYNCNGCIHPQVTGNSEEAVTSKRAEHMGIDDDKIDQHVVRQTQRIHHGVLLDSYAEWIKERRLTVAPTDQTSNLLLQCLNRSLLHSLLQVLRVERHQLLAMCLRRNWQTFAAKHGIDKSFEEVSEIDTAKLMLLRSKLPTT